MFDGDGRNTDVRPVLEACAVLGESGDGVLCVDVSGIVRYANTAAARILAHPVGELLGRDAAALAGADFGVGAERIWRSPAGTTVACRGYRVFLDDGMPGLLLVLHDEGPHEWSGNRSGLLGGPLGDAGPELHFFGTRSAWPACTGYEPDGYDGCQGTFPWLAAYETGILQIDMQHRMLAAFANRLGRSRQGAGATAGALLDEIVDYTDYHFRCEEAFMARYGIVNAHADLHCRRHGEGLSLMRRRVASCRAGNEDPFAFCADFVRWLTGHMLAEDRSLGEQIDAIEGGLAPVEAYRSTMLSAALECR